MHLPETTVTWERFVEMVNCHDLTYQYADDHQSYKVGHQQKMDIIAYSKAFDPDQVRQVWNAMVARRVREPERTMFDWVW